MGIKIAQLQTEDERANRPVIMPPLPPPKKGCAMNVETIKLIGEMQVQGWTVTFPAFGETRALAVRATKNDQEWTRGWVPNHAGSFEGAIKSLAETTGALSQV